jgi:hypothetical protein
VDIFPALMRDNVVRIPAPSLHRNDAGLAAIYSR